MSVFSQDPGRPLICLCPSYPPETTPTAIRSEQVIKRLARHRPVIVLTANPHAVSTPNVDVEVVPRPRFTRLLERLRKARLGRLVELAVWPDDDLLWVPSAVRRACSLITARRPSVCLAFTMPYSAGIAGLAIRRRTGIPLVTNLDDSPTCTDMHDHHPSRLHAAAARWMEDEFVRSSRAVVYVSRRNLERVRCRHPNLSERFFLIRYGTESIEGTAGRPLTTRPALRVVYTGAFTGWYEFIRDLKSPTLARRGFEFLTTIGRYSTTSLDHRTSSPVFIGLAVRELLTQRPDLKRPISVEVYGDTYPKGVSSEVLEQQGIADIVSISGPIPHASARGMAAGADVLFLCLPNRRTGDPGGRISAKTFEYLTTDKPIIAAVPEGENRDYLKDWAGVWLVMPDDVDGMKRALEEIAGAAIAGTPLRFDRTEQRAELGYDDRAQRFELLLRSALLSDHA